VPERQEKGDNSNAIPKKRVGIPYKDIPEKTQKLEMSDKTGGSRTVERPEKGW